LKPTADPHYVGGLVGVMTVLHTWGLTLTYHPHVHCLVTGGGISADGPQWLPARPDYLVPVQALSKLFRGLVLDRIRWQLPELELPASVRQKDWVAPPQRFGTLDHHPFAPAGSRSAQNGRSPSPNRTRRWFRPAEISLF